MAKEPNMKTKISKALSNFKTAKSVSGSILRTKAPKGIRSLAGSVLGNSAKSKKKR
ncbi:MAG: hypothetical protein QOG00_1933 [Pyrinomonadaceae bacterium]|nr:hypothetical protein [Pyrinomonadaceae bacterium]